MITAGDADYNANYTRQHCAVSNDAQSPIIHEAVEAEASGPWGTMIRRWCSSSSDNLDQQWRLQFMQLLEAKFGWGTANNHFTRRDANDSSRKRSKTVYNVKYTDLLTWGCG